VPQNKQPENNNPERDFNPPKFNQLPKEEIILLLKNTAAFCRLGASDEKAQKDSKPDAVLRGWETQPSRVLSPLGLMARHSGGDG
jgi:hypothetical protein